MGGDATRTTASHTSSCCTAAIHIRRRLKRQRPGGPRRRHLAVARATCLDQTFLKHFVENYEYHLNIHIN